jgi:hypothetical protein
MVVSGVGEFDCPSRSFAIIDQQASLPGAEISADQIRLSLRYQPETLKMIGHIGTMLYCLS